MLYLIFSTIFIVPILLGNGKIFESFFGKFWNGMSSILISGIIFLTIIWTLLAFFCPINIYVELTFSIIGIGAFFYFKLSDPIFHFIQKNKSIGLFILMALLIASFPPFILDHFGYYVPTINVLKTDGLVKGISNLDLIVGQNSLWHIFQAGFSSFADPFLRINVVSFIIFLIYIFEKKKWALLVLSPILLLFSQSPSPDLPVIIFSLMILSEIISGNRNLTQLFALSVFVFAIKPTMIWVPLFVFSIIFLEPKKNIKFISGGLFILLLYIFKNLYTFGFPIFPMQLFDINVAWKPSPEILNFSSQSAIQKTFDMKYTYDEIQHFSYSDLITNWIFIGGIKSLMNISLLIGLTIFGGFALRSKSKVIHFLFISILIKSVAVLIFSAQYRFFIDIFFVIAFVLLDRIISKKSAFVIFGFFSFLTTCFLIFPNFTKKNIPSFSLGSMMQGFSTLQFYKPGHFGLNNYTTHKIGNLEFNLVENYQLSFDTPFPAINPFFAAFYSRSGIFPQWIDNDSKKGFCWVKLNDVEKEKLGKIIEEWKKRNLNQKP